MGSEQLNLANHPDIKPNLLQQKGVLAQMQGEEAKAQNAPQKPSDAPLRWMVVAKEGKTKVEALPNTFEVDFTTVSTRQESIEAPKLLRIFNYKIDLGAKIEAFKENYIKNCSLSKSHNLIVARFAEMKVGFYGFLLSMLGVASEEIEKLQKKAIRDAIRQNKILFEENEYNGELLSVIGGGGKQLKAQKRAIDEIRKQLTLHAQRLGMKGYYTRERVLEIQIKECQKILGGFVEEKMNLKYQLSYFGVN